MRNSERTLSRFFCHRSENDEKLSGAVFMMVRYVVSKIRVQTKGAFGNPDNGWFRPLADDIP
jgi:RNA binding exosome subunit